MNATKVNAGLAESNGRLLLGIWRDSLHVTCGLNACTPGSAPGPTLGNEYGKTFYLFSYCHVKWHQPHVTIRINTFPQLLILLVFIVLLLLIANPTPLVNILGDRYSSRASLNSSKVVEELLSHIDYHKNCCMHCTVFHVFIDLYCNLFACID